MTKKGDKVKTMDNPITLQTLQGFQREFGTIHGEWVVSRHGQSAIAVALLRYTQTMVGPRPEDAYKLTGAKDFAGILLNLAEAQPAAKGSNKGVLQPIIDPDKTK